MEELNKKFLDLEQEFIVLAIPRETVDLEIRAKVYRRGELLDVRRQLNLIEIQDAVNEAQQGYTPSDAVFSVAPVGREKMQDLLERYMEYVE